MNELNIMLTDLEHDVAGLADYLRNTQHEESDRAETLWASLEDLRKEYARELADD